jgi:hypothetical protein
MLHYIMSIAIGSCCCCLPHMVRGCGAFTADKDKKGPPHRTMRRPSCNAIVDQAALGVDDAANCFSNSPEISESEKRCA